MSEKRFIVIDVPYENGEAFLYKKMLDKTTKKEYDNTLKGIDDMCDLSNKLHEENEQLKSENNKLKKENEELQQELFESEYECIAVHYHDNEVRRDAHIEMLKEEFKERFGRDFE